LSLWSQKKEARAPLGSVAAAVPQTRAAAAPVAPLQTAVTPTEHFLFTFFILKKTLYAVKVISPLRLFIRKETIKLHHVRTFFSFGNVMKKTDKKAN